MTMSHDRCQEDLILTVEEFAGCGWKAALAGTTWEDYYSMSNAFFSAAKQAISEDRQAHGKVLELLAHVCSMMLSSDSINEPFKPLTVLGGQRSMTPDDLSEDDVTFFAQIVDEIDDPCPKHICLRHVWPIWSGSYNAPVKSSSPWRLSIATGLSRWTQRPGCVTKMSAGRGQ